MGKFDLQDFRNFVESQIVYLGNTKRSLTKKQILDAVCQFDQPIYQVLNVASANGRAHLRRIFTLINKPKSVSVNFWFLHLWGYKKCCKCKNILSLTEFNLHSYTWNNKSSYCKICDGKRVCEYYKVHKGEKAKYNKKWHQNNKEKTTAITAKRRASKLQATPEWLTEQDYIEIEDIYWCAKEIECILGEKIHVDHIWPLSKGGLHVPWNLQILTASKNLQKKDKLLENTHNIQNFQQWLESL